MAQVGLAMLAGWMMPQAAAMDRSTAQMDHEGTCRPSWRPPPARHGCPAKALMRSRCMAHAASWFASGACRPRQRPPGGKEQAVHRRPSNLPPCVDLPVFSLSGARRPDAPAAWAPVRLVRHGDTQPHKHTHPHAPHAGEGPPPSKGSEAGAGVARHERTTEEEEIDRPIGRGLHSAHASA